MVTSWVNMPRLWPLSQRPLVTSGSWKQFDYMKYGVWPQDNRETWRDVTGQQGGVRHWVSSTQPEASVEQRSTSSKTVRGRMKGMWFQSRSWMCQNGLKWFGGRELQMVLKELQHHIISFSIKHGLWNQPCAAVRSSKELLPVLVCRSMWLFTARLQAAEGLLNMWTDFGVTQCFKITNGSLLSENGELSVVVPQTGKC